MKEVRVQRLSFWILFVASLLSIGWSRRGSDFFPQRIALGIVGGLQHTVSAVGTATVGTVRSVSDLRNLRKEYDLLLEELQRYRSVASDLDALVQENARLRSQLGFLENSEYQVIPGKVIAKSDSTIYSSLTINRGERHGIRVGQPVVAYVNGEEGLVGRVLRVSGSYAVVLPVFAVNSYVGARLERTRHEGLVEGTGLVDEPLTMRYVASEAREGIEYGAPVVTSGLSSRFPPGLRIGTVREVSSPPYEPSLVLSLTAIVDFDRLEYVAILSEVVQ